MFQDNQGRYEIILLTDIGSSYGGFGSWEVQVVREGGEGLSDVHFYKNTSHSLRIFMNFDNFSIHQMEDSVRLLWIVNDYLLLGWKKTSAAATEELVEVDESHGEDHGHHQEVTACEDERNVVILEKVWLSKYGET